MAMCEEGGTGAGIAYIKPSDNRGVGSWVGNQLEDYSDGTRVLFVINGGASESVKAVTGADSKINASTATPKPKPTAKAQLTLEAEVDESVIYYQNCNAVRAAGAAPLYKEIQSIHLNLIVTKTE